MFVPCSPPGSGLGRTKLSRPLVSTVATIALLFCLAAAVFAPRADALTVSWYGGGTCWQSGFPSSNAQTCDSVGDQYLNVSGSGLNGLAHMRGDAVNADVRTTQSGDYCMVYNSDLRYPQSGPTPYAQPEFIYPNNNNHNAVTGFVPSGDLWRYQLGDNHNDVCQAQGTKWGQRLSGSQNNNCTAAGIVCGMHHYASFASQGYNDRPYGTQFGSSPRPSFNVTVTTRAQSATGATWGYVCPQFKDSTTGNVVEYCLQQWQYNGGNIPAGRIDGYPTCAGASTAPGEPIDQVISTFGQNTNYATQRSGSGDTFAFTAGGGTRTFSASISYQDFQRALVAINSSVPNQPPAYNLPNNTAGCGRSGSTNPADWALIGVEQGIEGGGFSQAGGYSQDLSLYTTVDTLYPGETLYQNQGLPSYDDGYDLIMQPDGNLVLYKLNPTQAVWSTGTAGHPGARLVMQNDGNLVVYDTNNAPLWSTSTYRANTRNQLIVLPNGDIIVGTGAKVRWSRLGGGLAPAGARLLSGESKWAETNPAKPSAPSASTGVATKRITAKAFKRLTASKFTRPGAVLPFDATSRGKTPAAALVPRSTGRKVSADKQYALCLQGAETQSTIDQAHARTAARRRQLRKSYRNAKAACVRGSKPERLSSAKRSTTSR